MGRPVSEAVKSEINGVACTAEIFVKLDFLEGPVLIWTGLGPKLFTDTVEEEYTGVGSLLGVDRVQETQELRSVTTELQLNGVDSELVPLAYAGTWKNRKARVWLVFFSDATGAQVASHPLYSGLMDVMVDDDDGETATLGLTVVNQFIDHSKGKSARLTHEAQNAFAPGDLGLSHIPTIQRETLTWGRS